MLSAHGHGEIKDGRDCCVLNGGENNGHCLQEGKGKVPPLERGQRMQYTKVLFQENPQEILSRYKGKMALIHCLFSQFKVT